MFDIICIPLFQVFTHSYALNVHLRTHSKENHFMCHECKKVFQVGRVLPTTGQDNYTAGSLQNPQQSLEFKLGQLWLNVDLSNQTNTYNQNWDIRE